MARHSPRRVPALCALLFLVHTRLAADIPRLSPEEASRYIEDFIRRWDDHRVPPTWRALFAVALIASSGMALSALWLGPYRSDLASRARLLLRAYLLAAGIGLLLAGACVRLDLLPEIVQRVIPARYINMALLTYLPLVVGLLGAIRPSRVGYTILWALVGGLYVINQFPGLSPWKKKILLLLLVGSAVGCAAARWAFSRRRAVPATDDVRRSWASFLLLLLPLASVSRGLPFVAFALRFLASLREGDGPAGRWPARVRYGLAALSVLVAFLATGMLLKRTADYYANSDLQDWRNNPFYRAIHDRPGMVVTSGDLLFVQLRSRKAVVFPRDINFLTYFPEAGPDMDRTLRALFGFGLADPPPEVNHGGVLPGGVGRTVWEARPPDEWQRLAAEFRFSGVVAPDTWRVQLPMIARDDDLILYAVPGT